jgi:hypothetical protein
MLMGFGLCPCNIMAQRALPVTLADWMGKIPAAPANCKGAFAQTTFDGRCATYHQPLAFEKLKKDEERVRNDLASAASQNERSKANAQIQAQQAKQQAAQYQDINTPEMKAKIAAMSDAEKMQFATQMQQQMNNSGAVGQPVQENNSSLALLNKIGTISGKLTTELITMVGERNKPESEFNKVAPSDDFSACHGACPCINQKTKQANEQKADLTDKLILQETTVFNNHKALVTSYLSTIDNYMRDLKYGDLLLDENNKRMLISYQANELVAVDAFVDLSSSLYERGAKAYCEVKTPQVCVEQNTCFAATASVTMADGSHKNIIDVVAGDEVRAYDFISANMVVSKVTGKSVHAGGGYQLYKLIGSAEQLLAGNVSEGFFESNIELMATGNHPVYVKDFGWKRVDELKPGDELFRNARSGKTGLFKVNNVCKFAAADVVYSLETEGGNFFVEETLVKAK